MGKTSTFDGKKKEMTFLDYYKAIPMFPKRDFVRKLMELCEVSENTVYNWVSGRSKPQKESHYRILSEITGIEEKSLFAN